MDDQQLEHKVIITTKGEQIPVQSPAGVTVRVDLPNDPVKDEVALDVTPDEFKDIQKLAVTNDIPADILKHKKD